MELFILSGSFTSLSLWLFALALPSSNSKDQGSLRLVRSIPAFGPHQYLRISPENDAVYATTWSHPPALYAFALPSLGYLGSAPITATSSYITIRDKWMYSAGGPTGEVHRLPFPDPIKEQQFLFVPEDQLETADKTRVALRSGSHAIEFSEGAVTRAYVPVLATDSVHVYIMDGETGLLHEENILKTPSGSGPRHIQLHPNGEVLYVVTEHNNTLLSYSIPSFVLLGAHTIYPPPSSPLSSKVSADHAVYRGDTLALSSEEGFPSTLFATTRGSTSATLGWLAAFPLTPSGILYDAESSDITYWQTPTSGGKANAIDVVPYPGTEGRSLVVLTDDDASTREITPPHERIMPSLYVLEYSGPGALQVLASYTDVNIKGSSHAVFTSAFDSANIQAQHDEL